MRIDFWREVKGLMADGDTLETNSEHNCRFGLSKGRAWSLAFWFLGGKGRIEGMFLAWVWIARGRE